jgi:hypothetical protein
MRKERLTHFVHALSALLLSARDHSTDLTLSLLHYFYCFLSIDLYHAQHEYLMPGPFNQ